MARGLRLLACAVASLALAAAPTALAQAPDFTVAGYLSWWSAADRPEMIDDLAADQLTHIIYAFGAIDDDGTVALADPCYEIGDCDGPPAPEGLSEESTFARLYALKDNHPHLKILIAFGGWTGSAPFSGIAASAQGRARFARSIIDVFFAPYPGLFDGVDIDWEYPVESGLQEGTPADRENFSLLLAAIRDALDDIVSQRRMELSVAVAAPPGMIATTYPHDLGAHVDRVNVMTYDYHAGASVTHFNAPLAAIPNDPTLGSNVSASIAAWQQAGVEASKLSIGIPAYGRAFSKVPASRDGLLQKADPAGTEMWSGEGIPYRNLIEGRPVERGFEAFWSDAAAVPYLYDADGGVWISYDDPRSVAEKTTFARRNGLGGVFMWELGSDDGSLLAAVGTALSETP